MTTQKFQAKFEEKKQLTKEVMYYSFEYKQPYTIDILGGQGLQVLIDGKFSEEISICGQPSINHGFEILVGNNMNKSTISFFKDLEFGVVIEGQAPVNEFRLQKSISGKEYVFIATGVRIASVKSMILELIRDRQEKSKKITLLWGLESVKDLFWEHDFMDLSDGFDNFYFFPILKKPPADWSLFSGTLSSYLETNKFDNKAIFYIDVDSSAKSDLEDLLSHSDYTSQNIIFHS